MALNCKDCGMLKTKKNTTLCAGKWYAVRCKKCAVKYQRKWQKENPEKNRAKAYRWYVKNTKSRKPVIIYE